MTLKGKEKAQRVNGGFLAGLPFTRLSCGAERDGGQANAPTPFFEGVVERVLVDGRPRQKRTADADDRCQHKT